jgi:hypothetical protein
MLVEVTTIHDFMAKHGEPLTVDNRYLFADGAVAKADLRGEGYTFIDPPANEARLMERKIAYYEAAHNRAAGDFHRYENDAIESLNFAMGNPGNPPPHPETKQRLEALAAIAQNLQAKLTELRAAYSQTPEQQLLLQRQQFDRARDETLRLQQQELVAVTIDAPAPAKLTPDHLQLQKQAQDQTLNFFSQALGVPVPQ